MACLPKLRIRRCRLFWQRAYPKVDGKRPEQINHGDNFGTAATAFLDRLTNSPSAATAEPPAIDCFLLACMRCTPTVGTGQHGRGRGVLGGSLSFVTKMGPTAAVKRGRTKAIARPILWRRRKRSKQLASDDNRPMKEEGNCRKPRVSRVGQANGSTHLFCARRLDGELQKTRRPEDMIAPIPGGSGLSVAQGKGPRPGWQSQLVGPCVER